MFRKKSKIYAIYYFTIIFIFSCKHNLIEKNNFIRNGYNISMTINDSISLKFNDTVVFIFERGFKNDNVKISNNKNILVNKIITTDSIFSIANHFRFKRENFFWVEINHVIVKVHFPDKIYAAYINKDSTSKNIDFLLSNESHFYQ